MNTWISSKQFSFGFALTQTSLTRLHFRKILSTSDALIFLQFSRTMMSFEIFLNIKWNFGWIDVSNVGSVVEFSPATREARVRFPDVANFSFSKMFLWFFLLQIDCHLYRDNPYRPFESNQRDGDLAHGNNSTFLLDLEFRFRLLLRHHRIDLHSNVEFELANR